MKKLIAFALTVALVLSLGIAAMAETAENPYYRSEYEENFQFVWSTKGITKLKSKAAANQGTVENLEYETPAYAVNAVTGGDYTITKSVNIYLPYGYDPARNYNVLYLMHGGGDNQDYWLTEKSDRTHGKTTGRVLDHMIEDGVCDPVIIVTPTFYSRVEGVELDPTECQRVADEFGEPTYNTIDQLFTIYFAQELRNQIIPAVEARYATFANGDVSEENLIATRDHRAFSGLSMGSMTSFHSVMMQNVDLFAYCGSFSGAKTDGALLKKCIDEKFADYEIKFWYHGNGVDDIAFQEHYDLYGELMQTMSDKLHDNENCAMVVLGDGAHNYAAWIVDLYNVLTVFFK